jgi:AraC-like DNA-binding protein
MNITTLTDKTKINAPGLQINHDIHCLGDNACLSLTRSFSNETITLKRNFRHNQRQAALHFIFNGQTSFSQNDHVPTALFGGDKCNLMLVQPFDTEQTISLKGDFMMASFYIDLDRFIALLQDAMEALPDKFKKAVYKNVCSCNNFRWSPQAYYTVNQLLNVKTNTPSAKLFMESKMLELIAVLLETEQCDYYSNISLSKTDRNKVKFIHELLLKDLSACYTLEQLSRQAGTNEFVLKKGFREMFGKPVYQYLLQKRMERAMHLISTTYQPINVIAGTVGYEDASAFTRAFKNVFSLLPTQVRKNSNYE